jgi:xylose isomerase
VHAIGQALWAGKLFHVDLNAQQIGRYDQDFRFGAQDLVQNFHLVRLLEDAGYQGPRHFDAHAYRSEDADGVWDFAAGCMRTYLLLARKAREFAASSAIRDALAAAGVPDLSEPTVGAYDAGTAGTLVEESHGLEALAVRGYGNERLDQAVVDLLLGA